MNRKKPCTGARSLPTMLDICVKCGSLCRLFWRQKLKICLLPHRRWQQTSCHFYSKAKLKFWKSSGCLRTSSHCWCLSFNVLVVLWQTVHWLQRAGLHAGRSSACAGTVSAKDLHAGPPLMFYWNSSIFLWHYSDSHITLHFVDVYYATLREGSLVNQKAAILTPIGLLKKVGFEADD